MNHATITLLTIITLFIAACGGPGLTTPPPKATQIPSTFTPAPMITITPVPVSTHTPTPMAEATSVPGSMTVSVSFAQDVMPILNASCNKCHGIEQVKEGLDMTSYEKLVAGSFNGPVIVPGNAAESFLVQQVVEGEMPKRGDKLTSQQIQVISDWINGGALKN